MAANGNSGNGNTGTATSASQAQSQAASTNAANSNAANAPSGESAAKGEASKGNATASNNATATNAAGLNAAKSESEAKGQAASTNASNSNTSNAMFPGGIPGLGGESYQSWSQNQSSDNTYGPSNSWESVISGLLSQPTQVDTKNNFLGYRNSPTPQANLNKLGTTRNRALAAAAKTFAEGGDDEDAGRAYANTYFGNDNNIANNGIHTSKLSSAQKDSDISAILGVNTSPTTSSTPTATTTTMSPAVNSSPANNTNTNVGATPSVSDATNAGVISRGETVANSGTSVTDSGTGGSISSGINVPSRDSSSIGLGVYNTDRANYDQDNWNRGMEVESSSLVSDEECKAFAKRAFMENSEPFKKVRITIIKKV